MIGKFEGSGLTVDDIKAVIKQIDENGDNEIDFEEFVKCVNEIYETVSKKSGGKGNKKK